MTREELAKAIREDYERKGVWACKSNTINMQLDFEMLGIILEALEQEPCEDAVSRETVEDIRKALLVWANNFMSTETINNIFDRILERAEQEVEPEPNTGDWREADTNQYACSHCNYCFSIVSEDNAIEEYKYCPNCGARMFEPQESEDKR